MAVLHNKLKKLRETEPHVEIYENNEIKIYFGKNETIQKFEKHDVVYEFEGPTGSERLVKLTQDDRTEYYEGPTGNERLVKKTQGDRTGYYEGPKGSEKLFKVTYQDGKVGYYEGPKGSERLVKKTHNGQTYYYDLQGKLIPQSNNENPNKKRKTEDNSCVICMDNPRKFAFSPCGHFCICQTCVGGLKFCPICTGEVSGTLEIFHS